MNETVSYPKSGIHRQRLAKALRTLSAEVVACDTPDDTFFELGKAVDVFRETLKNRPRRYRQVGFIENDTGGQGKEFNYGIIDFSPVSGAANPLSPPLHIRREKNNRVTGLVNFPASFEGPPGAVHGGYVAAVFDELLGVAHSGTGQPGMTGILTIHYRSPCPLHTDIHMNSRINRIRGELVFTEAAMYAGYLLVAEAEGIFFTIKEDKYKQFAETRNERL